MTLADLLKLIRRYIVLFIVIVVACTLVGGALGFMKVKAEMRTFTENDSKNSYSDLLMAQSTLLVSSQVGGVGGIASAVANSWNEAHNDRYDEWLLSENERMQDQLDASTNTSSKKSIETAPGSWLKSNNYQEFKDLTIVETQTFEASNTVLVVAIGPEATFCIEAANEVSEKTEKLAHELFDENSTSTDGAALYFNGSNSIILENRNINVTLIRATNAISAYPLIDENVVMISANKTANSQETISEPPSLFKTLIKYGIIGFAGGAVFALLVILLINIIRKPIKNGEELAANLEVPVLLFPNSQNDGEMTFTNMRLAAGDNACNVCIASVHDPSVATTVYNMVKKYDSPNNPIFKNVGSLTTSGVSVEAASKSDGVVLCMREWKDSIPEFEDALNELAIANARIIGVAVLS